MRPGRRRRHHTQRPAACSPQLGRLTRQPVGHTGAACALNAVGLSGLRPQLNSCQLCSQAPSASLPAHSNAACIQENSCVAAVGARTYRGSPTNRIPCTLNFSACECPQLVLVRLLGVFVQYSRLLPEAIAEGNIDHAKLLPAVRMPRMLRSAHFRTAWASTFPPYVSLETHRCLVPAGPADAAAQHPVASPETTARHRNQPADNSTLDWLKQVSCKTGLSGSLSCASVDQPTCLRQQRSKLCSMQSATPSREPDAAADI